MLNSPGHAVTNRAIRSSMMAAHDRMSAQPLRLPRQLLAGELRRQRDAWLWSFVFLLSLLQELIP